MLLSDFDYHLPNDLIAREPIAERTHSRLLCVNSMGQYKDQLFKEFPLFLEKGDVLIFNNTQVLKARLFGQKATGGKVEVLIERLVTPHEAWVHLKASHPPKKREYFTLANQTVEIMGREEGGLFHLKLCASQTFADLMETAGQLPLPPYFERQADALDETRYQTVYATIPGAVAAPTAGLHFDLPLLKQLDEMGIQRGEVTLHVGAGTFQPVRTEKIEDHVMHKERFFIPEATVELIEKAQSEGRRIMAIGTTSLRALEGSAQLHGGKLQSGWNETQIFIRPGYTFQIVDRLLTNFHLPQSTLLMLVSAFSKTEWIQQVYAHAIEKNYRFFSYGDAMLLDRSMA